MTIQIIQVTVPRSSKISGYHYRKFSSFQEMIPRTSKISGYRYLEVKFHAQKFTFIIYNLHFQTAAPPLKRII